MVNNFNLISAEAGGKVAAYVADNGNGASVTNLPRNANTLVRVENNRVSIQVSIPCPHDGQITAVLTVNGTDKSYDLELGNGGTATAEFVNVVPAP